MIEFVGEVRFLVAKEVRASDPFGVLEKLRSLYDGEWQEANDCEDMMVLHVAGMESYQAHPIVRDLWRGPFGDHILIEFDGPMVWAVDIPIERNSPEE